MIGKGYLRKVIKLLEMYSNWDYQTTKDLKCKTSCNICLGREEGETLFFDLSDERTQRIEFAHRGCLENLQDEEERALFIKRNLDLVEQISGRIEGTKRQ